MICVGLLLFVWPPHSYRSPEEKNPDGMTQAKCVIALGGYKSKAVSYSIGFNYEMLRRAADILRCDMEITLSANQRAVLDSLEAGVLDLAVLPFADSSLARHPGLQKCSIMADSTVWVTTEGRALSAASLNTSLSSLKYSQDYNNILERFSPSYEPYSRVASGRHFNNASPYDSILKEAAKELGWDWRMLASLVWQESRFRIESRSRRGAEGLLQLMEQTAIAYNGSAERLDPKENLRAGVNYLKKLQRMFREDAASEEELIRFTLAAFNAGEGRIKDCIKLAQSKGLPYSTWTELKAAIPFMRDSLTIDSLEIRTGVFKGVETIAHVEKTDSLYKAFCIIAP
ncbi:MAG: transglycosylase SLT domain-containing protein [Bacteroidales bacterium]|nr:transglycosylase SLT domain-containing protein [Bacteroidales bacterium]